MHYVPRKFQSLTIFFLFIVGSALSAGIVGAFSHPNYPLERMSKEGDMRISALYLSHESSEADTTSFRLNLNSHYLDLEKYDIQSMSYIRVDKGSLWPATKSVASGDGHYVQGILSFAGHELHGSRHVQLAMKGVDGSEDRVFEWKAAVE